MPIANYRLLEFLHGTDGRRVFRFRLSTVNPSTLRPASKTQLLPALKLYGVNEGNLRLSVMRLHGATRREKGVLK